MKVRIFVPRESDPANGSGISGIDYNFPMLPSVGNALRLEDQPTGEFTVVKVGFIQEGPSFVAAVWLQGANAKAPSKSDRTTKGDGDRYRDLNYDVPPESMESY